MEVEIGKLVIAVELVDMSVLGKERLASENDVALVEYSLVDDDDDGDLVANLDAKLV